MHLLVLGVGSVLAFAVAKGEPAVDQSKGLDFWVGSWKCEGEMHGADGKLTRTTATNLITKEMKGQVIHEHFKMNGLNGESFSVYNPQKKAWQQTWVDDSGGYIALTGSAENGKMTLATAPGPKGGVSRMVFTNISSKSFDWNWEKSQDGGKTWTLQWHLHYVRAGK